MAEKIEKKRTGEKNEGRGGEFENLLTHKYIHSVNDHRYF